MTDWRWCTKAIKRRTKCCGAFCYLCCHVVRSRGSVCGVGFPPCTHWPSASCCHVVRSRGSVCGVGFPPCTHWPSASCCHVVRSRGSVCGVGFPPCTHWPSASQRCFNGFESNKQACQSIDCWCLSHVQMVCIVFWISLLIILEDKKKSVIPKPHWWLKYYYNQILVLYQ